MASLGCPAGQRATKYHCKKRRKGRKAAAPKKGRCPNTKRVNGRTVPTKHHKFVKGRRCPVKA